MADFICADEGGRMGLGNTLKAAFQDFCFQHDEDTRPEDVVFYEATLLDVEVVLVKKEVVKSIKPAKV